MKLLVLDIDNTLFDWLGMWRVAFKASLCVLSEGSGHPPDILLDRIRTLHQQARTSERGFTADDAEHLGVSRSVAARAGEVFETTCLRWTRVYPDVSETLAELRRMGVRVALHTDAPVILAETRVSALELGPFIDGAFATDSGATVHRTRPSLGTTPIRGLKHPKPSAIALGTILLELGAHARDVVYLGDSKTHDIPMARAVGAVAVFAEYGCRRISEDYDLLRRVSHWNDEDIARERDRMKVEADHSVASFSEILTLFC
jgi:phosphoglycolate phosphatase-like HAD superfamily hydrolase